MMRTRSVARRVIPLRDALRKDAKPRAKKPTPSFPTADQVDGVISQLRTLLITEEAAKVDGELERLLIALGLDPASPAAWRDGFLLLAAMHHDVGKPRRTNKNAEKLCSDDDMILLREIIQLRGRGLTREQAINALASDPSKAHLFRFKAMSSIVQRRETLRWRLREIKKKSVDWKLLFGQPSITTVEKTLINLIVAGVGRNQRQF
jgi:hypothetical protein